MGGSGSIATLYARESLGQSSLIHDWEGKPAGTYYVPVVTLDSAIRCFRRPYYRKIDVEGWELEVLKGLTEVIPLISFEFHLGDEGVSRAAACPERLLAFGPSRVNLVPAEASTFHFSEWVPIAEFVRWFPGDLSDSLRGHSYGDVFVENSLIT